MAHLYFASLIALVSLLVLHSPIAYTLRLPPLPRPNHKPKSDPIASLPFNAFQYLDSANSWRGEVGVPPVKWSWALANATARYVKYQRKKHNCRPGNLNTIKFGATQYWASGFDVSPPNAVFAWANEKRYYNYTTNTCKPGHQCGVYKQLVWKTSKYFGCSQVKCPADFVKGAGLASSLTVCYYYPPGNINDGRPF